MSHEPNNVDPSVDPSAEQAALQEQLVAYLDGELDEAASQRVEELLATDPNVRDTLEKLDGTWAMLDDLERAHLDEVFTQSTIEMVAVAAADDAENQRAEIPRRRRRRWAIGSAGLFSTAVAGFLAFALFWPNPNEQLLDDLPVLENLEEYRQIGDFEFLERLLEKQDELFPEEDGDAA